MAKRKKTISKKKPNILKIIAWVLAILALVMISTAIGFMVGQDKIIHDEIQKKIPTKDKQLEILQKTEVLPTFDSVNTRLKEVVKKEVEEIKTYGGASHEYVTHDVKKAPLRIKREVKDTKKDKPRLVIIMDDVSRKSHVNAIKSLGLNITMSFLPPTAIIPHSATLASKEDSYMVHLPMEAQNYSSAEANTLLVKSTQEEVRLRIQKIKTLFPKVRYINNHTGSTYTQNQDAMEKLIVALNEHEISFVDSRTTGKTKVPRVMKKFGYKYVARDVFLDHHNDKDYIIGQIKQAIKISKNEGLAIAIGHPRKNTILALRESKALFNDVELVLIDKIY